MCHWPLSDVGPSFLLLVIEERLSRFWRSPGSGSGFVTLGHSSAGANPSLSSQVLAKNGSNNRVQAEEE
jgi:hypothetical protein